jgi:hypothetical protein
VRSNILLIRCASHSALAEELKRSRFNTPEDIAAFTQKFDEGLKRVFSDDTATQYIKFGSPRDNDPKYRIKAGRFMLTG